MLFMLVCAFAAASAQGLKAFISHKAYCSNNMQPYIEFTFIVGGNTVKYVQNDQKKYEAGVEIQVDMMQSDSLVKRLHYILSSDVFEDSVRVGKPDFADIQNIPLPRGEYFLYFYMRDVNADSNKISYIDKIDIDFPEDRVSTSKISLFRSMTSAKSNGLFVKYGYELPPLYSSFVSSSQYTRHNQSRCYNCGESIVKASS